MSVISGNKGGMMMNMKQILAFIALPLAVSGCDVSKESDGNVNLSVVPVIQQAITQHVPLFQGKINPGIMKYVCSYAAGEITREQFWNFFSQNNVDVKKLADQDAGFKFLANDNVQSYAEGCMAYIASQSFSYGMFAANYGNLNEGQLAEKLAAVTPVNIKVANYVAALAAASKNKVFDSIAAYKESLDKLLTTTSVDFVKDAVKTDMSTASYNATGAQNGYSYDLSNNGITLNLYGQPWLGKGYVLGKEYFVSIKNTNK